MSLRCLLLYTALAVVVAAKQRYDGKIVLSVIPKEEDHFKLLVELEEANKINIWNEMARNRSVHVMIDQNSQSYLTPMFESLDMNPSVIIDNVQKLIDAEERSMKIQARSSLGRVDPHATFHNFDLLTQYLRDTAATYPNLAQVTSIGKTHEGRDIWLIKITSPTGGNKKKAFLDFGIHAREWISPATGLYIIHELLTKYSTGGDAKTILDTWELHIVPVLNPDGYAHSHASDRMWRKNRRPSNGGCAGTDLNRNFGYQWNTGGSSSNPCLDTYHGGSPMSENEAKALQNYMTGKQWDTYLTVHSYGQWWFTVWGYTQTLPSNYNLLVQKAQVGANAIKSVNGRSYTIGSSAQLLYIASGGSDDWATGTLRITYSYTLELPPTGGNGFIVPVSEIKRTGAETYVGLVAYLKTF